MVGTYTIRTTVNVYEDSAKTILLETQHVDWSFVVSTPPVDCANDESLQLDPNDLVYTSGWQYTVQIRPNKPALKF